MRAVFIGAGSLAVVTAKLIRERGEEVVIIEQDKERIDALPGGNAGSSTSIDE